MYPSRHHAHLCLVLPDHLYLLHGRRVDGLVRTSLHIWVRGALGACEFVDIKSDFGGGGGGGGGRGGVGLSCGFFGDEG